jgi:hypothetical protein
LLIYAEKQKLVTDLEAYGPGGKKQKDEPKVKKTNIKLNMKRKLFDTIKGTVS